VFTHGVRTAADERVTSAAALEKLKEGNKRFVAGTTTRTKFDAAHRQALANHGQNPFAAVVGCADSRCPLEILSIANQVTSSFCETLETPARMPKEVW